jgi:hypothetical protein
MELGMQMMALSLKSQTNLARGIVVCHYEHKMTQVPGHGGSIFQNLDYVKLQQVEHYASILKWGHSHLIKQDKNNLNI